jgi:hypothetical protein
MGVIDRIPDKSVREVSNDSKKILEFNEKYVRIIEIRHPKKKDETYAIVEYIDFTSPIERIRKKKINFNQIPIAIREFNAQEGKKITSVYGKHEIYDIVTGKCLNLPRGMHSITIYDLGVEFASIIRNSADYFIDRLPTRDELLSRGKEFVQGLPTGREVIDTVKHNINVSLNERNKRKKERKKYSEMGLREQRNFRRQVRNNVICITLVVSAAISLIPQGQYQLNKKHMEGSASVYIDPYSYVTMDDREIINNYPRFEKVINTLYFGDHRELDEDDIVFLSDTFLDMFISNANNHKSNYINYEFNYDNLLPNSSRTFRRLAGEYWNACGRRLDGTYNPEAGYEFCCHILNLMYAPESLTYHYNCKGKDIWLPLDDIRTFRKLNPLEKLIILSQIESIIKVHGFSFKKGDCPRWCTNFVNGQASKGAGEFLNKIEEEKQRCITELQMLIRPQSKKI